MKEIKSHITLCHGPGLSFFLILLIVLPLILAPLSDTYGQRKKAEDSMKAAGLIHMNAGRYGEAIDLFNKYISANPRKSEGYNLRGLCFEKRVQYKYAVLDFRRAIKLDPKNEEARENLRRTQKIWYAQLRDKIKGHKREIAIDPSIAKNYLEIGKSHRWLEEWALAEEWYDKYLARDDNASPDEIIRYTEILAKTGHIRKGEIILKKFVERYPEDWRLRSRYGFFLLWLSKYRSAENQFEIALSFKPFFKEAQDGLDIARKEAYLTQNDPRAFEREFPIDRYYRLLRKNPDNTNIRFKLIDDLIKAGRIEEAYTQLQLLNVDYSDDMEFIRRWDYVVERRERVYHQQIEKYKARLEKKPTDKVAVERLAEYYKLLEEYDSATVVLENYFAVVPGERNPKLRFQYAQVAAWDREFDMAIEIMDELLLADPNNLDYQLFRGQLSIWKDRDIELADEYINNVLKGNPQNLEALIAKGSLMLIYEEYDSAQVYANKAKEIDPMNNEVITLQTNIDFQKLRAEEEKLYSVLEEGRQLVLDNDCEGALVYYDEYLAQAEPNDLILKEYGDVLFCAGEYDEALSIYDEVLDDSYMYEASLQRAKVLYSLGDSLGSVIAFQKLVRDEPEEFEPRLYLGDSYARIAEYDSASVIYDTLLTWDLDSTETVMVQQRIDWIPPTGIGGILKQFPSGIGLAPMFQYYSDNISFKFSKIGARLDLGIFQYLTIGVSYYKSYVSADRDKLDSATVDLAEQTSLQFFTGERSFTTFKGHIFIPFTDWITLSAAMGIVNTPGSQTQPETEVYVIAEKKKEWKAAASYYSSDAVLVLYSPYLIDYSIDGVRLRSSLYSLNGYYIHKSGWLVSGFYDYITVSDGNVGNNVQFRIGKKLSKDFSGGYQYFYQNYKYVDVRLYYSPHDFETHSLWGDYQLDDTEDTDMILGGNIGFAPSTDQLVLEGHVRGAYQLSRAFSISGSIALGQTSRDNSTYRYFSAGISAYWSLY